MLCLGAGQAPAAGLTYEVTVEAGGHDRVNVPVKVLLVEAQQQANLDPVMLEGAQSVTLTDTAGVVLPAQLTPPGLLSERDAGSGQVVRELHFILPKLAKGESTKLKAVLSDDEAKGGFAWKQEPKQYAELSFGDRPVLRYMCRPLDLDQREQTYKVFHHLYDPAGTRFVTKGPGGQFTHHRGIFYGFNRVSYDGGRADIWHCSGDTHQSHEGLVAEAAGAVLGRHQLNVDWHGTPSKIFAKERRELTIYNVPGGQMVEFASRLSSTVGKVKLDGDPQHAGFQFRAAQDVAAGDQKATYYLRTDGQGQPGETRNWGRGNDECANRPWNAMSFVIEGKRYTAVYLDHPGNPKEARYSERSYGRFGSYFEYELDGGNDNEGNDLVINYRIWLQDGEMTVEEAAALCADFVEPVKASAD